MHTKKNIQLQNLENYSINTGYIVGLNYILYFVYIPHKSQDSSVGISTDYGLEDWMIGVRIPAGAGKFLFDTVSRPALGPTQPPIQWVIGLISLGVKRPKRETGHSPPSSAEVKECVELYLHSTNTSSWRGA
jgi:hypothetical protein